MLPRSAVWLLLAVLAQPLWASTDAHVAALLEKAKAPPGVVFEIAHGHADYLEWAIPQVVRYAGQLKKRFPALDIAVVSHGKEMFALKHEHASRYASVHRQVKSLVEDQSIPLHVCGTYAEWHQTAPEAFPDYVDVAPVGPVQIRNYEELGFVRIKIKRP